MKSVPATFHADVTIHYGDANDVALTTKEDSKEIRFHSLKAALDHCEGLQSKRLKHVAVMNALGKHVGNLVL